MCSSNLIRCCKTQHRHDIAEILLNVALSTKHQACFQSDTIVVSLQRSSYIVYAGYTKTFIEL